MVSSPRRAPNLATLTILAISYIAFCHLGLLLASVNRSATPIWPGTGIAFAAFLLLGRSAWPAIMLGAFLVNLATAGTAATSVGIALGNTLEGIAGAALVERWAGGRAMLDRPQDVFKFALLAGGLSTALSATIGVTTLSVGGFAEWGRFGSIWFTWWLGDMGGDLLIAPFLLAWALEPRIRRTRGEWVEITALLGALVMVTGLVFGTGRFGGDAYPLEFLCAPFLVWAAFRFGPRETATAALLLGSIAVWATLQGHGPFLRPDRNESLLLLQAFNATNSIMALALAAVVRERRRAQETLARQAAELARSNADLEQFAYVASHDLREPLRTVTSYVELLARRYRGRLDADADAFIKYAVDGARRMRDLIDGVLAFARAGKESAARVPTDCGDALDRAIANLKLAVEECDALITRDVLPRVRVDPAQMVQIFENLIGNALKFRRPVRPEVHVGAVRQGPAWVFSITDNGIGIKPELTAGIFRMFRRLHTPEEIPGIGIGLSICRNIVERHGGRIWVESEPGRGSTFRFALPADATS